jgi:hypothetical protein
MLSAGRVDCLSHIDLSQMRLLCRSGRGSSVIRRLNDFGALAPEGEAVDGALLNLVFDGGCKALTASRSKVLVECGFVVVDFVEDKARDERGRHEEFNEHDTPPSRRNSEAKPRL